MVVIQGRNSAPLLHLWSTMVKIVSWPWLFGSPVIRSMAIWLNRSVFSRMVILNRGTFGRCIKFLFC